MKKIKSDTNNLYFFLEAKGLFENGTHEELENAKKEYWKNYRKIYNRERRNKTRSYLITLSFKETDYVARQADKYQLDPTSYIKQAALSNDSRVIDKAAVVCIRELVILHYTEALSMSKNEGLPANKTERFVKQAAEIEKKVLEFFSSLK